MRIREGSLVYWNQKGDSAFGSIGLVIKKQLKYFPLRSKGVMHCTILWNDGLILSYDYAEYTRQTKVISF
jgi:hypothetical protein